jgi:hypothetical protein
VPNSEFEKLVKQFAEKKKPDADMEREFRAATKQQWISSVRALYDEINGWLHPLIDSKAVKLSRRLIKTHEQSLGQYEIESLEITLASKKLVFKPVGTVLVGAYGRIEVTGPKGSTTLLLLATDNTLPPSERRKNVNWYIANVVKNLYTRVPKNPPQMLDKAMFEQLFTDLFGIR